MASLRSQIKVFVDAELSPKARSEKLAKVAREGAAKLIAEGQASPEFEVFVDGREGAKLESVNPDSGTIVHEFVYIRDAVAFALEYLEARAPRVTGKLVDSIMIAVNGRDVRKGSLDIDKIPPDAEVHIFASVPYSRKADVQLEGKRRLRFSTPAGMYADAARAVSARFGNTVTARRVYTLEFPGRYRRKTGQVGRFVEYPAIEIRVRD
ncbi:hypothetical protein [Roseomonas sp. USHLN139]|uniref:hypothetical protein n=1 Tax=Roseomonas sp. USHLN139 TaxID=3081298 RepID=UPI003B011E9F